ncbi:MAG: ABC transporter ATP-binding protein, partial [Clostridiales bacterium]|nr:ABC transporter ATP-binding protein [Clostridiales bacterium]
MVKTILKSVRQYKKPSILSILFVSLEVIAECFIPLLMSRLIDEMNSGVLSRVWKYAVALVALAFFSLLCGILAGRACAVASAGLAKNLTRDMFKKITKYSFKNVDDFSSSSLVTRMTTDVGNVQMAYMMIVRTAVRAPFMLVFSATMAFVMSPRLAWIFVVVIPILLLGLGIVILKSFPRFKRVFKEYDKVNESVQENVAGIRTVKSYVREEHEKQKFGKASNKLKTDFTKAERIVALNAPLMHFSVFMLNVVVIFVGALLIIKTSHIGANGEPVWGALSVGRLSSLLTYGLQSLMSLMMLSMIVVMIALSVESARRIKEVLTTESNIVSPENPVCEVKDGSVTFKGVSFKYNENAAKPALEDVNLTIGSGQTIGILGGTGSSKTTLVNLISRLYDVS